MPVDGSLGSRDTLEIYTDGASRGNPGPGACAYVFVANDDVLETAGEYLGDVTNNQAEYHAVIRALTAAAGTRHGPVVLHSDSQLVINQLRGDWRVTADTLRPLYDRALQRVGALEDLTLRHVPRENAYVGRADERCNEVLDRELGHG